MKQQLEAIRKAALDAISDAGKAEDLEALRVRYLGKKGELTAVLKQMGKLSAEERPVIGQLANDVRAKLEADIEEKTKELADKAMELKLKSEAVDVTIPGKQEKIGVKHPMYQVLDEIKDIFVGMGFEILEDREVETADYNFTKLNCLEGHPAREWTDTFYSKLFLGNIKLLSLEASTVADRLNSYVSIQLGLSGGASMGYQQQMVSTATLMLVAPLLVLYLFAQRSFVESIAASGIKG